MNRPIEFRVWQPHKQRMLSFSELIDNGWNLWDIERMNNLESTSIIMQFTGIYDKNGKKIFKGDKLKNKNTIFVVEYYDYTGGWQLTINGEYATILCENNAGLLEVIGNIFENKNLIEP